MPPMTDLAVVLVTWNVRDLVMEALRSLYADLERGGLRADVYVVDSASSDGTPDAIRAAFPHVTLIASPTNLGFGAANNVALRAIMAADDPPPAIYLLNPDTYTHPDATIHLYRYLMSDPRIGLVGARLEYGDGTFQHGAFGFPGLRQLWTEFFPTPGRWIEGEFNGRYPKQAYDQGVPFAVDFVLGATMMLRREVIERTGMFDEYFFMYCEEIDWAMRIRRAGWQVCTVPAAVVTHFAGKSTAQVRPDMVRQLWKSRLLLYHKHYSTPKVVLGRLLIALGMALKLRRTRDPAEREAYQHVLKMALRSI